MRVEKDLLCIIFPFKIFFRIFFKLFWNFYCPYAVILIHEKSPSIFSFHKHSRNPVYFRIIIIFFFPKSKPFIY